MTHSSSHNTILILEISQSSVLLHIYPQFWVYFVVMRLCEVYKGAEENFKYFQFVIHILTE